MINFSKIQNNLYFIYFFIVYIQLIPFICILLTPIYKKIILTSYIKYTIENVLKVKMIVTKDAEYIHSGFILANHRSIFDFWIDPYLAKSIVISRRLAYIVFIFMHLLHEINYGIIMIIRSKDTRQKIYKKIKNKMKLKPEKVLFYPEGSRLRYNKLYTYEDIKTYLKYGILKEIYYDKKNFPVQLQISSNKELVIDERLFKISKGICVKTHITKPIYPADFQTEMEFYDFIAKEWYNAWKITHLQ
jgi:1-acyl-sn-glycerol-3-phosphate acyltransferase